MSSNAHRVSLALATAVLFTFAAASTVPANEQVRAETVKFTDLNLDSPAGVQALYDRIHAAAKRVCRDTDPLQHVAETSCARNAEARAIEKASLPQLTAFYKTQSTGQSQPLIAGR